MNKYLRFRPKKATWAIRSSCSWLCYSMATGRTPVSPAGRQGGYPLSQVVSHRLTLYYFSCWWLPILRFNHSFQYISGCFDSKSNGVCAIYIKCAKRESIEASYLWTTRWTVVSGFPVDCWLNILHTNLLSIDSSTCGFVHSLSFSGCGVSLFTVVIWGELWEHLGCNNSELCTLSTAVLFCVVSLELPDITSLFWACL